MEKIINIYKPRGLTPYQLIQKFRKKFPEYKNEKIGYAGRLDPLAHGVMVLMVGEENKNRQKYLELDKSYEFVVFFGVETDSYDYLGLLKNLEYKSTPAGLETRLPLIIKKYTGKKSLPYPPFSSMTINGIPMYKLAKMGKLKNKKIPEKTVEIYNLQFLSLMQISSKIISGQIFASLIQVKGYFRQKKTLALWQDFFQKYPNKKFTLAKLKVECSSGTYVRTLVNLIGQDLQTGAIAYEIFRTKSGDFKIEDSLKLG